MPQFPRSLVIAILLAGGCAGKNYNVANPVLGPPPPRVAKAVEQARQTALAQAETPAAKSDIQQVSATYDAESPLAETAVIARVNGRPLLAGDILEQYGAQMAKYEGELTKAVAAGALSEEDKGKYMRKAQEMVIRRDLDRMIEQMLMAQAVRSKLKKEQLEAVNKQVDSYFEKDVIASLKTKFKIDSTAELEVMLQDQGTSLETMRRMYADQQMASQYVRTKIGDEPKPTRAELLAVYNKQIEKYARPMQVKWQQLQISMTPQRNRAATEKLIEEVLAQIDAGMTFDAAVKKYSDGAHKENGGHWDWTQPNSVANPDIRKALEGLKAGQHSKVISTPTALQIVRVTERREAGTQPLDEVQEDIRMQIIEEWREERVKAVMDEVKASAVIETIFDKDTSESSEDN